MLLQEEEVAEHEEEAAQEDGRHNAEAADLEGRTVQLMPVVTDGMKQMEEHAEIIDKQVGNLFFFSPLT